MCGLVGVAGNINLKYEKVFKLLLQVDCIRGEHSTGVAFINDNNEVNLVKKAVLPNELFQMRAFTDAMKDTFMCLLGHNRQATKGAINHVNAHPFEFDNIVGAHNGTLSAQHRLPEHAQFKVDSENVFYAIDKDGELETVPKLQGAYTLTWWDKETQQLKLIRNKERPLYYCYDKAETTVFWASEAWMLAAILLREGVEHTKIKGVAEDSLYTFDIGAAQGKTPSAKLQPVRTNLRGYVIPPYVAPLYSQAGGYGHGNFGGRGGPRAAFNANATKPGRLSLMNKEMEFTVKGVGYAPPNKYAQWTKEEEWYIEGWNSWGDDVRAFVDDSSHHFYQLASRVSGLEGILTIRMVPTTDSMGRFEGEIVTPTLTVTKPQCPSTLVSKRGILKLIKRIDRATQERLADEKALKEKEEEADENADLLIKDHRDRWIDERAFNQRYGNCGICDVGLDFEDKEMYLSSHTEGFCGRCMTSPGVMDEAKINNGVMT